MTTEISKLVLMIIAILGLAQAGFLMLLLRHEGKRVSRQSLVDGFCFCILSELHRRYYRCFPDSEVDVDSCAGFHGDDLCLRAVHLFVLPRNCRPTGIETNLPFPGSASGSGGNFRNGVDSV